MMIGGGRRIRGWLAALAVGAVLVATVGGVLGIEFVRFALRERRDAMPCPSCKHEAFLKGQALVDDKARPLRFSTAAAALDYERSYVQP